MIRAFILAAASLALAGAAAPPALAADLPVKAPVAAPAPVYNWTGFYLGANLGYGWGDNDVTSAGGSPAALDIINVLGPFFDRFSVRSRGVIGGVQAGYNWQFAPQWLLGAEADFDASGIKGSETLNTGAFTGVFKTAEAKLDWLGTVRARLGFLPFDRLLVFGTGGFAYGETKLSGRFDSAVGMGFLVVIGGDVLACNAPNCIAGSSSKVSAGWTAGGGLEYALWQNVTLRAEYLYVDLGDRTVRLFNPPNSGFVDINFTQRFSIARAAINWRF